MEKAKKLFEIAREISTHNPFFLKTKGPGEGNKETNKFIKLLQRQAKKKFRKDFSEKKICGNNNFSVDYYFPKESTIVEIAFGLRNSKTEFEKDIFKALLAKEKNKVNRLIFICKSGGQEKCHQSGRGDIISWVKKNHNIKIEIWDI